MRIVRYLKNSKLAVTLIVVLLLVQAFCDLALPNYTADIVDVGIQQSGVEHPSPDALRSSTYDDVIMLSDDASAEVIASSYESSDDGTYRITDEGLSDRSRLDEAITHPLVLSLMLSKADPDQIEAARSAYASGALSSEDRRQMVATADEQLDQSGDAIVTQQAIAAAAEEYRALGYDMDSLRMNYLIAIGLQMLAIAALGAAAAVVISFIASRTAAKIGAGLREGFFSKVVGFSDNEIQSFSAASLITRGTNDIQQIQMVLVMMLRMVLYSPILAIGGIIMVSRTSFSMSWTIVLAVVVLAVIVMVLMILAMPRFKIMQSLIDRVNLVSREILTGLPVIRAFGRQRFEEQRFNVASTKLYSTQLFTGRTMAFMMPAMMLVMNGVSVLIVWVGGSYIDAGTIQVGDMIAFITYSMVIIMSFLMISMIAIMLPRAEVAAGRIDEVLATESSIHDPHKPEAKFSDEGHGARIVFDDVTFSYKGSNEPVLSNVSFTAEPGSTTAIIGSTGCGKSTILKLIERFYDVDSGTVSVDGVDVRTATQHDLRCRLGYVPQKAFLFSGTIESNVAYSADTMSQETVDLALDVAQATNFVSQKEEGVASAVSQGGTNVSGGQRQRLAIARALATDARAFLFDDSFSALDYRTDAALRQALSEKLAGRTVLIVAQRISTIMHADRIVVLENGTIVGQGTHDELLSSCDTYREIAESQLSPEELAGVSA